MRGSGSKGGGETTIVPPEIGPSNEDGEKGREGERMERRGNPFFARDRNKIRRKERWWWTREIGVREQEATFAARVSLD